MSAELIAALIAALGPTNAVWRTVTTPTLTW